MKNEKKVIVKRLIRPEEIISESCKDVTQVNLISPVSRMNMYVCEDPSNDTLKSPVKRLNDSNESIYHDKYDNSCIDQNDNHLKVAARKIESDAFSNIIYTKANGEIFSDLQNENDIYMDTIFYDRTQPLLREYYRKRKIQEVKGILGTRTKEIEANGLYISDYLLNECSRWFNVKNSFIFIESGTGTGKSTFIETFVEKYKLKTLLLTNRKIAKEQIKNRLEIHEVSEYLSVCGYHTVEDNFEIDVKYLDSFDVIALDEIHYWLSDSQINNCANLSYLKILSTQKAMKIGLSATIDDIREKIIGDMLMDDRDGLVTANRIFNYHMEKNASYISSINGFIDWERLVPQIVNSEGKWLIFVDKTKDGNALMKELQKYELLKDDVVFINRTDYNKAKKDDLIKITFNEIVKKSSFSVKVCITTKMLDNSVNIKDTDLKHVVISEDDKTTFLQMLGRKRCYGEKDDFKLYIPYGDRNSIANKRSNCMSFYEYMANVYYRLQNCRYLNYYLGKNDEKGEEYRACIYINTYRNSVEFNVLGYIKAENDINQLEILLDNDIFKTKVGWVVNHLNYRPNIIDLRIRNFMDEINDVVGKNYRKSDKEVKIEVNEAFKKQFGIMDKSDNYDSISLDRLQQKFDKEEIPLKIKETKRRFKIEKR